MAMTYTSLTAAKGTSGSIANWVSFSLLDLPPIVDEAQALIYTMLRVREMRSVYRFRLDAGESFVALPSRFLDPIGRLYSTSDAAYFRHLGEGTVLNARIFSETSGTLGANPFTTTSGSSQVLVSFTAHGFSTGSTFDVSGATAVGGLSLNGSFEIVDIATDSFTIETGGSNATSTATGGGSAATYICDNLVQGYPGCWSIWNERVYFDAAFNASKVLQLQYYQSLPLLSSTNQSNFLTDRYPFLMRTACVAMAADFMQDTEEYNKSVQRLAQLVQTVMVENDGAYRGAEIDTDTP